MNAPSNMNGKSNAPDVFEAVENLRNKAKSQIKTANMIGKFVTPILRRKITSFVTGQVASVTRLAEPAKSSPSRATTPPKPVADASALPATSPTRKRSTGASTTSATPSEATTAARGTPSASAAAKATGKPAAKAKTKPVAKSAATPTARPTTTSTAKPAAKAKPVGKPGAKRPGPSIPRADKVSVGSASTFAGPAAKRAPQRTSNGSSRAVRAELDERETSENPLGIDGYDGLPSSSIVPLLDGLSQPQLRAVETYEQANRARRTVLHRAKQLQSS